jgi:ethanolamine utilization microcompartment shell protein EutS
MLTIKVINTPSKGIIQVLCRRVADEIVKEKLKKGVYTSLGLIQGPLAAMITAGDLAEKTSNVEIAEIIGNCPQHITVLGVFGDTSSVSEALKAVEIWEKQDML